MTLKTLNERTSKLSSILHLDTYTAADRLIISKPPGEKFLIGRVYVASPLIAQAQEFADVICEVVKTQSDDSVIQITQIAVPDIEAAERMLVGKTHGGAALAELLKSQAQLMRDASSIGWRDDLPLLNRRLVIACVSSPAAKIDEAALESARALHLALLTNLRACGFADVEVLDAAGLAGQIRQLANLFTPGTPVELDELAEFRYQIFPPDLTMDFRDRRVGVIGGDPAGDVYCAAVTCKSYPREPFYGLMNLVTGAPLNSGTVAKGGGTRIATPFMITTTIRIADQKREATRIDQAIDSRLKPTRIPIKLGIEDPEEKLKDLTKLKKQSGSDADSNKYVYVSLTAFLFGRSREQVSAAQSLLISKLSHFKFDARAVVGNAFVRWAQSLPMNFSANIAKALDCEAVMSSQASTTLLPVFGDYTGNADPAATGRGGMAFFTRRGGAYGLDILRTDSTTHGCISASAGSGKTVLAQYFVENLLAEGMNVFVLDNNRGLLNLATTVGGQFNEFHSTGGFQVSLNPFTGLTDDEFDEQQETITSLLMMMSYDGESAASGARIAMNEAVKAAWGRSQGDTEVGHVLEALESIRSSGAESDMKNEVVIAAMNLIPRLKAFLESPTRGRFFRGKGTARSYSQLTVFDTHGLGDDLHLKRCVNFFLLNQLSTQAKNLPGHKIAVVDEAHAILDDPQAEKALEGLSLKSRKDGLALWVILQSLNKMAEMSAGRVMMNMSAWMIVLAQKEEETNKALADGLLARYAKDNFFVRALADVTTRKGVFSEAMIIGEQGYEVVRLYLDRTKATLYSSERGDRDAIFDLVEKGVPALEAVRRLQGDRSVRRRDWLRSIVAQLSTDEGLTPREIAAELLEASK